MKEYEGGSTDGLSYDGLGPSLPSIIGPYHPLMLRLHGWKSPSLLLGFLCLYALPGSRSTKKRGYLPGSLAQQGPSCPVQVDLDAASEDEKKAYKRSASFRPSRPDASAYRGGPRVQIDPIVHDCCSSTHGAASKSCWWRSGGCLRALAFLLVQVPQDAKTRFKTIFFSDKQEYELVEWAGGGK